MPAKLQLTRPREPSLAPIEVAAPADTGALVLGDEASLRAIPMEETDLVVNPRDRSVDVNPDSPNLARTICKRAA